MCVNINVCFVSHISLCPSHICHLLYTYIYIYIWVSYNFKCRLLRTQTVHRRKFVICNCVRELKVCKGLARKPNYIASRKETRRRSRKKITVGHQINNYNPKLMPCCPFVELWLLLSLSLSFTSVFYILGVYDSYTIVTRPYNIEPMHIYVLSRKCVRKEMAKPNHIRDNNRKNYNLWKWVVYIYSLNDDGSLFLTFFLCFNINESNWNEFVCTILTYSHTAYTMYHWSKRYIYIYIKKMYTLGASFWITAIYTISFSNMIIWRWVRLRLASFCHPHISDGSV